MALQAFDTNMLAYAAGLRRVDADEAKIEFAARLILPIMAARELVLPAQVLAELHNLLRRRAALSAREATSIVEEYAASALVVATDTAVLERAFALTGRHELQTYDSIVLSAAALAGCDILYSEDMQDGFEWEGVRIVNPFA